MNVSEAYIAAELERRGWDVFRRGWPDFLVVNRSTGRGYGLELKGRSDKLREEQRAMHRALKLFGLHTTVRYYDDHKLLTYEGERLRSYESLRTLDTLHRSRIAKVQHLERQIAKLTVELQQLQGAVA